MSKKLFTYSWLEIREILFIAWQSLLTHKTRSGLTMLGIIFGVAAVISMLSIGEGARQETLEQIEVMGMRNIIIRSKEANKENLDKSSIRPLGISMKDANALRQVCPFISAVSVSWESSMEARTYKGHSQVMVVGSQTEYAKLFNVKTVVGKFFSPLHDIRGANVCVLGSEAKQKLFGFTNPIGKLVKLGDQWFTVLGVAAPKKIASTVSGITLRNYNLDIYVPLKTAMVKFPREQKATARVFGRRGFFRSRRSQTAFVDRNTIDQITVQISADQDILQAAGAIQKILARRHNQQKDVEIIIPEALIEQSQKTQQIFNIVMGAIAGISLLVGGIGIMNIMLASVLERTREIGIRRAVGATRRLVIIQFLSEATVLSIAGGIIGIFLGWGLTNIITVYAGWRTIVSAWSIMLAFGVSAATGILFGYYPAREAANKDPIEALRYDA